MKIYKFNSHAIIRCICLFICVMGISIIGFYNNKVQGITKTELANVFLNSEDNAIIIKGDSPNWSICDYVTIQIKDDTGIVYEKNIWLIVEKTSYRNGEHGKAYTVSVSAHYRSGSFGKKIEKKSLF